MKYDQLTIPNPCTQDWSSMTQDDTGKYCAHCSKSVIDFSQLTDSEMIQILEQSPDNICGRLRKEQLNRILIPPRATNNSKFQTIITAFLSLVTIGDTRASDRQCTPVEMVSFNGDSVFAQERVPKQQQQITDGVNNMVQGWLYDSLSKAPLIGATVLIRDTKTGVIADAKGKFILTIPDSLLTPIIQLEVKYFGYLDFNINIDPKDLPITNAVFYILPAESVCVLGGIVGLKPKKWWQFWK